MQDTPGIEEALSERLSEIVGKELSKRQVSNIVELFADNSANTITDELIKALQKIEQMSDCGSYETSIVKMKSIATDAIKGCKANPLHRVVEVKSAGEILDCSAGKLKHNTSIFHLGQCHYCYGNKIIQQHL